MLKIRLRRMGARNAPFYRVVVSDSRSTPGSSAVEEVGYYDPTRNPSEISLKRGRIEHWVSQGAQMSSTVRDLMSKTAEDAATTEEASPAS